MALTAYQEDTGVIQSVTPSKPLPVTTGSGTASLKIQGADANGSTTTFNPVDVSGVYNTTAPTLSDGQRNVLGLGSRGSLKVELWGGGSSAAMQAPTSGLDGSSNNSQGLLTYGRTSLFNGTTWDRQVSIPGATDITGRGVTAVHTSPNSHATSGIALNATAAVASSLVLKASAGNLYGINVVAGASAGYVMVFNATSAPADGTVTPVFCMPIAANAGFAFQWDTPIVCSTGITVVFSTTGPFTKTASATAFISGMAK